MVYMVNRQGIDDAGEMDDMMCQRKILCCMRWRYHAETAWFPVEASPPHGRLFCFGYWVAGWRLSLTNQPMQHNTCRACMRSIRSVPWMTRPNRNREYIYAPWPWLHRRFMLCYLSQVWPFHSMDRWAILSCLALISSRSIGPSKCNSKREKLPPSQITVRFSFSR
jgi:hypothetical protein